MAKCCVCNKNLTRYLESGGRKFCSEECWKTTWPTCTACKKPMNGGITYDGKPYCSDRCAQSALPECESCGKRMKQWLIYEGKKFCSDECAKSVWPRCVICGKTMKEWKVDENGIKYCSQECFLQACPKCSVCGKHMMSWKSYEDGKKYCSQHCLETRYPGVVFRELPDNYGCFDVLFRDVETDGRKAGYIEAAQKYDDFLELLIKKAEQVKSSIQNSRDDLYNLFKSICEERDSELRLREPKIKTLLEKYKGKVNRDAIMKQLEFNPKCPFQSITFSECCLPALFFGIIGIAYSAKLAKFKRSRIAGWQDARKAWKKKIDAETSKLSDIINSGNQAIQNMVMCIFELLAYKIQNAELDFINEE